MDNLWAPWRMEYILDKRKHEGVDSCIFCDLKDVKPDSQNLVLARGKNSYVVMNRFPYNNGHLLVIPYKHATKVNALTPQTQREVMWFTGEGIDILKDCLNAEGFNCGLNLGRVSGCGILHHIHWHIVPRWNGDTNFMPVLGEAKPMPEYLAQTYDKLIGRFHALRLE